MDERALELKYQLCFRLYAASRNMTRIYQPILDEYGLTYPQYILLLILFEHETMDFKELSRQIDLKTPTLTPIVQKLVEMGYVIKEKNKSDQRRINVTLTKEGQSLKKELIKVPYNLADTLNIDEKHYYKLTEELDFLLEKFQQLHQ